MGIYPTVCKYKNIQRMCLFIYEICPCLIFRFYMKTIFKAMLECNVIISRSKIILEKENKLKNVRFLSLLFQIFFLR